MKRLEIASGSISKRILDDLLEAKLNGNMRTKRDELDFVKRNYQASPESGFGI